MSVPVTRTNVGDDSYYGRLQVDRGASHDDIVRAYRRLARSSHPDFHPHDPEAPSRFRSVTEAYEVLGDRYRRAAYDQQIGLASIQLQTPDRPGPPSGAPPSGGSGPGDIGDQRHRGDPSFMQVSRPGSPPARGTDLILGLWEGWKGQTDLSSPEVSPAVRWVAEASGVLRRLVESWWDT